MTVSRSTDTSRPPIVWTVTMGVVKTVERDWDYRVTGTTQKDLDLFIRNESAVRLLKLISIKTIKILKVAS